MQSSGILSGDVLAPNIIGMPTPADAIHTSTMVKMTLLSFLCFE